LDEPGENGRMEESTASYWIQKEAVRPIDMPGAVPKSLTELRPDVAQSNVRPGQLPAPQRKPFAVIPPGPIHFTIYVSGGQHPIINGTVNLPDGTYLLVMLLKPLLPSADQLRAAGMPPCDGGCVPMPETVGGMSMLYPVIGGRFTAGPFSYNGRPVGPGIYRLHIGIVPDVDFDGPQSEVRAELDRFKEWTQADISVSADGSGR
jgi:hypothetical protein